MTDESPTFEQAMQELEAVVEKLEAGGLTLEETIKLFERGQALMTLCSKALDEAALRLQQVRPAADGGVEVVPFDGPEV